MSDHPFTTPPWETTPHCTQLRHHCVRQSHVRFVCGKFLPINNPLSSLQIKFICPRWCDKHSTSEPGRLGRDYQLQTERERVRWHEQGGIYKRVTQHCVATLESKHETSKSRRYKPEAINLTVNISDVYICSSTRKELFNAAPKKPLKIIKISWKQV
jgi:hypothetical protein